MGIIAKQLEKLASHKNYINGIALYNSDLVELIEEENNIGEEYYHFEIYFNDDEIYYVKFNSESTIDSKCSCDFKPKGKICKHIVASGLMHNNIMKKRRRIEQSRR